jgi:hypothetical protein
LVKIKNNLMEEEVEEPCSKTSLGCVWVYDDDWYDDIADTYYRGDCFCTDCYRIRDWLKAEYEDNK